MLSWVVCTICAYFSCAKFCFSTCFTDSWCDFGGCFIAFVRRIHELAEQHWRGGRKSLRAVQNA